MSEKTTQPSLPDAWQKAVWHQLREIRELINIQAQEVKTLRLRVEWLESQIEKLTDTQPLS